MPQVSMVIDNRMQKLGISRYMLASNLAGKLGTTDAAMGKRLVRIWAGRADLSLELVVAVANEIGLELTIGDKE